MDRRRRDEAQLVARILCHFFARALARNCHLDRGPRLWRRSGPRADRAANFGAGGRACGRGNSSHGAGERVGKNDRRARDDHRAGRVAFWRVHGFRGAKDALNTIWGVTVKPGRAFFTLVHDRFLSFSIVLAIGFLLLVSLVLSAVLAALGKYMSARLPLPAAVWQACDFLVSFAVISALFAMIFKVLPNVRIGWHDVRIGAVGTALLFTIGKFLIGLYLGTSSIASSFGAAGSVVIVLVWIFYSSCILFFGAEFTKVYARKFGSGIVPNSRAVLMSDLLRAKLSSAPTPR